MRPSSCMCTLTCGSISVLGRICAQDPQSTSYGRAPSCEKKCLCCTVYSVQCTVYSAVQLHERGTVRDVAVQPMTREMFPFLPPFPFLARSLARSLRTACGCCGGGALRA
eukprot:2993273-Rhodomonas_salina.1